MDFEEVNMIAMTIVLVVVVVVVVVAEVEGVIYLSYHGPDSQTQISLLYTLN